MENGTRGVLAAIARKKLLQPSRVQLIVLLVDGCSGGRMPEWSRCLLLEPLLSKLLLHPLLMLLEAVGLGHGGGEIVLTNHSAADSPSCTRGSRDAG